MAVEVCTYLTVTEAYKGLWRSGYIQMALALRQLACVWRGDRAMHMVDPGWLCTDIDTVVLYIVRLIRRVPLLVVHVVRPK